MEGTHNWHVWVKHVKHRGMIVNLLVIFHANSLFLSALTISLSLLSKKSISHEHLNITDKLPATGFSIVS